jgi:hypothetical protein
LDRPEGQRSFAVAGQGLLFQAGPAGTHEGKFGGDEEGIQPDQRDNGREAKGDRCPIQCRFHLTPRVTATPIPGEGVKATTTTIITTTGPGLDR